MRERIRLRRDSAANWTANNPILASGEPGVELDSNRLKIGNGVTRWNNLQYLVADSYLSNLIIGDGHHNAIYWSPPDRLNIVGSGGTTIAFDDLTNTISINVPVSINNNNIANFIPGTTPSGLPITTSSDGLIVATGINSSLISNFNSSVSGLLPSVTGTGYVFSSFANNIYSIAVTGLQPSGNYITHITGSTGIFVSNNGSAYTIAVTGIVGGGGGNSNMTISNHGDNRVLTSDGSISGIHAESGLLFDGNNLSVRNGFLASTGNFSSGLFVGGIPVSISGHSHQPSDITNFNSAVSGLLPVKNILPGNNVNISNTNGNFTISANGGGGGSPSNVNAVKGSFILTSPSSIFHINEGYTIGSLDVFLNGVKLSILGDYEASNGTSFSLTEAAPSGSIVEYLALAPTANISDILNKNVVLTTGNQSISGSLSIDGAFSATTKSFKINHPLYSGMYLEYGSLESPYHGIRLTGKSSIISNFCSVGLPSYIKDLIHYNDINIQITNYKHSNILYVNNIDIEQGFFEVQTDSDVNNLEFFWTLTGVRKDINPLIVETNT